MTGFVAGPHRDEPPGGHGRARQISSDEGDPEAIQGGVRQRSGIVDAQMTADVDRMRSAVLDEAPTARCRSRRVSVARAFVVLQVCRNRRRTPFMQIIRGRAGDLPDDLFAGAPADLIMVDTGNYYPRERDGRIDDIEAGQTDSGWVEQRLGPRRGMAQRQ